MPGAPLPRALCLLAVVGLLAGCGSGGGTARRSVCSAHWVGTWAASPSDASALRPTLADQTLRMIVAPHLAGAEARVQLSNRFGSAPITLGPASIATAGRGAALVPGSERALTFAGAPTVTIQPGAEVVSDAIPLPITPFHDLAVSVAVPGTVAGPTEHLVTRQRSYLSAPGSGDHAGDVAGGVFTQPTTTSFSTGWYFLDAVDVQAPAGTGAVVAFGDSLTDGYQGRGVPFAEQLATIDTDGRYPDDLARRLSAAAVPLSVLNAGIAGDDLLGRGLSRFASDALGQAGVSDVIVLEGINDLVGSAHAHPAQLIAAYQRLIAAAHAAGVRIQLGTLTPDGAAGGAPANAAREQVNAWIRGQHLADGVVDFDAAVRDPADPARLAPADDGSDHIHLDLAGYRAMAAAVDLRELAGPSC